MPVQELHLISTANGLKSLAPLRRALLHDDSVMVIPQSAASPQNADAFSARLMVNVGGQGQGTVFAARWYLWRIIVAALEPWPDGGSVKIIDPASPEEVSHASGATPAS